MHIGYLPAITNPEILEVNFQRLAGEHVDVIITVHVMWIVAWISGTGKLVILHISTSCHLKTYLKGEQCHMMSYLG